MKMSKIRIMGMCFGIALLTDLYLLNSNITKTNENVNNIHHSINIIEDRVFKLENIKKYKKVDKEFIDQYIEIKSNKYEKINNKKDISDKDISLFSSFEKVKLEITYYTSLPCENGGYSGVTTRCEKLTRGMCATSKKVPYDTVFYCPSVKMLNSVNNELRVADRMYEPCTIPKHGGIRVDIYVPKIEGETDDQYFKRVNTYTKDRPQFTEAYIMNWGKNK